MLETFKETRIAWHWIEIGRLSADKVVKFFISVWNNGAMILKSRIEKFF